MTNHLFSQISQRMPAASQRFAELADGRVYSYGDVVTVSAQFANALVSLGVKPVIAWPCRWTRASRR